MKIVTKKDIQHIAFLSRLNLSEEEIITYEQQLENILEYMTKLREVNTDNVEPVSHIILLLKNKIPLETNYREDVPIDSNLQKEILSNAPESINTYFKVERVIE
jgi:aspartyl-tRNA(Asn)/glutamyl-tRNA(Gln) amidotransferase subunit C